jgi:proteasome accessory factor B
MISVRADAPKDLDEHKEVIRTLMEATGEEMKITMRYYSVHSQKRKDYRVHPYRLLYFRGGMYLFAYVEEYEQIRTFAIERIEAIEKLRDRFERPSDFSVESYLESSFGVIREDPSDVEIVFGPEISEYVRSRVWHPSQTCREMDGGRIRMNLHVGGEFELVSWILSFGPSARVITPERLRRRVETELARALDNYRAEVTVVPPKKLKKVELRKSAATIGRKN